MALRHDRHASDVVRVLVRDKYRIDVGVTQTRERESLLQLPGPKTAVDEQAAHGAPVPPLDYRGVACTAAAQIPKSQC